MRSRQFIYPLVGMVIAVLLVWWSRQQTPAGESPVDGIVDRGATPPRRAGPAPPTHIASASVADLAAEFPLAAELNAPNSTISQDLDVLSRIMDGWRTNFPREGNPVGENSEIAAALTGDNRLGLVLIPKDHPALNQRGELCDRWGTPFRFHQISGEQMEVRSAGPDRKFGTADDALWSPGS